MQGRGVQNYSDKPSHEITAATTEFDDALLSRGIVTEEQVYLAKGASTSEAVRLAQAKRGENKAESAASATDKPQQLTAKDDGDDDDSFVDDEEDDAFMAKYREERLKELQQQSTAAPSFTSIHHITREQWKEHVNEASMNDRWVIVVLVDSYCQDKVTQELHQLGREYDELQLRTIDAHQAIPNWPSDRTPTLFAYHNGVKTQEIIASKRGEFPPATMLAEFFRQWGVFRDEYDDVD